MKKTSAKLNQGYYFQLENIDRDTELTSSEKRALCFIVNFYTSGTQICYSSISYMCYRLGVKSEKTIENILNSLQEKGLITQRKIPGSQYMQKIPTEKAIEKYKLYHIVIKYAAGLDDEGKVILTDEDNLEDETCQDDDAEQSHNDDETESCWATQSQTPGEDDELSKSWNTHSIGSPF